jgi:hypothetical protein
MEFELLQPANQRMVASPTQPEVPCRACGFKRGGLLFHRYKTHRRRHDIHPFPACTNQMRIKNQYHHRILDVHFKGQKWCGSRKVSGYTGLGNRAGADR